MRMAASTLSVSARILGEIPFWAKTVLDTPDVVTGFQRHELLVGNVVHLELGPGGILGGQPVVLPHQQAEALIFNENILQIAVGGLGGDEGQIHLALVYHLL